MQRKKMKLGLYQTSSLKYAKSLIGRTNHSLLTILVSLDTTENLKYDEICINDYAVDTWNPNYETFKSFPLSKLFISNATLAWAIDALDAYYRISNTSPKLIQNKSLEDKICGAQNSVSYCHKAMINHFTSLSRFDCCIISLAITWRNNIVHHIAENEVFSETKRELLEIEQNLEKIFYELNISKMILNAELKKTPSYKELNAIIRTIIHYLEKLDELLILELDIDSYANQVLKHHFFTEYTRGENILLSNFCKKSLERKKDILKRILLTNGFTDINPIKEISDNYIEIFSKRNYKDLFAMFRTASN